MSVFRYESHDSFFARSEKRFGFAYEGLVCSRNRIHAFASIDFDDAARNVDGSTRGLDRGAIDFDARTADLDGRPSGGENDFPRGIHGNIRARLQHAIAPRQQLEFSARLHGTVGSHVHREIGADGSFRLSTRGKHHVTTDRMLRFPTYRDTLITTHIFDARTGNVDFFGSANALGSAPANGFTPIAANRGRPIATNIERLIRRYGR
jgi:hypothetical protein